MFYSLCNVYFFAYTDTLCIRENPVILLPLLCNLLTYKGGSSAFDLVMIHIHFKAVSEREVLHMD